MLDKCVNGKYDILLAGNPNVGKSTVFNALTRSNRHTGNWSGKTVDAAQGSCRFNSCEFILTDIPGTYSQTAVSPDEEVAGKHILYDRGDCIVIVVDGTSLERNLNLVLRISESTNKAVLCVNMMDEARKKKIYIDTDELSLQLGMPVVPVSARSKKGLDELMQAVYDVVTGKRKCFTIKHRYDEDIEKAAQGIEAELNGRDDKRALSLMLLDRQERKSLSEHFGICSTDELKSAFENADALTERYNDISDRINECTVKECERIYKLCVSLGNENYRQNDRKIDKILTSGKTGIPIMLLLFMLIFYITMVGANYPSEWLKSLFDIIEVWLRELFVKYGADSFWTGLIIDGMYGTLASVISVMLPPMAIFFPLFTLLEDLGYLPRVAFNLDGFFCKAGTNGKQALTMMMGFGCNACGVTGCRIIGAERERKLAVLTNNFSPCNGRFPTMIALISTFIVGSVPQPFRSFCGAGILVGVIALSIILSLLVTKLFSVIMTKSNAESFILELPPYRKPQIVKTLVRSLFDKTAKVLARAVIVAIPAGALIWLLANISIGGSSLIESFTSVLEPFAGVIGLDGVILAAFILGFPANEIVFPIALMIYSSSGSMTDYESLSELHNILISNGWTIITAICALIFTVMHFPCSTTCITIYKETKNLKWTILSVIVPTLCGIICCMIVNLLGQIFA